MNKKEMIEFLEPLDDDIKIVVRGANKALMSPISYKLELVPECEYHADIVVINMISAGAVDTGVSG